MVALVMRTAWSSPGAASVPGGVQGSLGCLGSEECPDGIVPLPKGAE